MADSSSSNGTQSTDANIQLTCFTEEAHDVTLHFQIISLTKQVLFNFIICSDVFNVDVIDIVFIVLPGRKP